MHVQADYTDCSKEGEKVVAAAVLEGEVYQFRLPNNASVFSAELKAIDLALSHIEQDAYWRYIILPLIVNTLDKISRICETVDLVFCWLPSGNEEADKAVTEALLLDFLSFNVPFNDFKPLINNFIGNVLQQSWSDSFNQNNKLFTVKPPLGE